ncbi:MAG: hypothetical protein U0441_21385 [Polyangiaceae bacterium]
MTTTRKGPSLGLQALFLLGPVIFLFLGVGFFVGSVTAPPGSTTDDGYPLGTFFTIMGSTFGGLGVLWLAGAIWGIGWSRKKNAEAEARRDYLLRYGAHVQARVLSCESEGYMDFQNNVYADLVLLYDVPGVGRRQVQKRIAIPQAALDQARAGGPLPILVDPRAPDDYMLP